MSELIQKHDNRATIRWKLLTGVSALALTAYVSSNTLARAEDSGRPEIWIELGGQLSGLDDGQATFAPLFPNSPSRPSIFSSSQKFEHPPRFSFDEDGKLSFQPDNSDWIFSASIVYGRSASHKHAHQQITPKTWVGYYTNTSGRSYRNYALPDAGRFADTAAQNSEHHFVLDFEVGKDVGLGTLGSENGTSVLGLGVRFVQFTSKSNISLKSNPDWRFFYASSPAFLSFGWTTSKIAVGQIYHSNSASLRAARSFHGVGPSISWNASVPVAGNPQDSQLTVDWGISAALLFGRQRVRIHQQTTGRYHGAKYPTASRPITFQGPAHPVQTRSRDVTVPNVGGSVGVSWSLQNFKMSFGYKADFFFNAIDGGIDACKEKNRAFYGPYASISVGLP